MFQEYTIYPNGVRKNVRIGKYNTIAVDELNDTDNFF